MRETADGKVEVAFLELRSLIGMPPEQPLSLRGRLIDQLQPVGEATAQALRDRADLQGFRAIENLAAARIEQARAEGRWDASVTAGYQRAHMGFPSLGLMKMADYNQSGATFII